MEICMPDKYIRHYHSTKKALVELHKVRVFYNLTDSKLLNLTRKLIEPIKLVGIFIIINIITRDFRGDSLRRSLKASGFFVILYQLKEYSILDR